MCVFVDISKIGKYLHVLLGRRRDGSVLLIGRSLRPKGGGPTPRPAPASSWNLEITLAKISGYFSSEMRVVMLVCVINHPRKKTDCAILCFSAQMERVTFWGMGCNKAFVKKRNRPLTWPRGEEQLHRPRTVFT